MSKTINKFFNKYDIAIIMIAIFFIADRWLKSLALNQASQPARILIGQLFLFNFHPNYYIAFSLPLSGWPIITLILLIIISLIIIIFYLILNKRKQKLLIILLTIILFGAISNILDRLIYGYVIDYLQLRYFAIFNLADVMISLSIIFLIKINLKKENMLTNFRNQHSIELGRNSLENTGGELELLFLGEADTQKYKDKAYRYLNHIESNLNPDEEFRIRDLAQRTFQETMALADRNKYIDFKTSMKLVEECQSGNPENPKTIFAKALLVNINAIFGEKYKIKFFSAIGTHLDVSHGIDCFFKLYNKETNEEEALATVDVTGREAKDSTKANVLIKISREEINKLDANKNNQNFDEELFIKKINEYAGQIAKALEADYLKEK